MYMFAYINISASISYVYELLWCNFINAQANTSHRSALLSALCILLFSHYVLAIYNNSE